MCEYNLNDLRRLDILPGITGPEQIEKYLSLPGEIDKSFDDSYKDFSIGLYLKIIIRTIIAVLKESGLKNRL